MRLCQYLPALSLAHRSPLWHALSSDVLVIRATRFFRRSSTQRHSWMQISCLTGRPTTLRSTLNLACEPQSTSKDIARLRTPASLDANACVAPFFGPPLALDDPREHYADEVRRFRSPRLGCRLRRTQESAESRIAMARRSSASRAATMAPLRPATATSPPGRSSPGDTVRTNDRTTDSMHLPLPRRHSDPLPPRHR